MDTSSEKPHIVLVHGANCVPQHHHKLQQALQAAGFAVDLPFLPTSEGTTPATATTDDDIAVVRDHVSSLVDQGKNILVLVHSYGGIVGSSALRGLDQKSRAAKGLAGGVTQLVYLTAFMVREGQSLRNIVQSFGFEELLKQVFDFREDGTCLPLYPDQGVFGGLEGEDLQESSKLMVPWATAALDGKCTYAAWKNIPSTYIYGTQDAWVPTVYQDWFLQQAKEDGAEVQVEKFDVGHAMQVQNPNGVVEVVKRTCGL